MGKWNPQKPKLGKQKFVRYEMVVQEPFEPIELVWQEPGHFLNLVPRS
jgi:hypothetical protein